MILKKGRFKEEFHNRTTDDFAATSALDTFVQFLITTLVGIFPWMGIPGLNLIINWLLTLAITKVLQLINTWFAIDVIPAVVQGQLDAYNAAKVILQNLPENASEADIAKAKQQFDTNFSALIHIRIYGV